MKTAMQELIDKLDKVPHGVYDIAEELLEKEKQQIIAACNLGLMTDPKENPEIIFSGENYYNNIYKNA